MKTAEQIITNEVSSETKVTSLTTDTTVVTTETAVIPSAPSPKEVKEEKAEKADTDKVKTSKTEKKKEKLVKTDKKAEKKTSKDKSVKEEVKEEKTEKKKTSKLVVKNKKDKSKTEEKKEKEKLPESIRDKMFPAVLTVHGVKFVRVEDTDIAKAKLQNNNINNINQLLRFYHNEDKVIMFGVHMPNEELVPRGKNQMSNYSKYTGLKEVPSQFPNEIEMNLVDVILNLQMEVYLVHSVYTEYPGTIDFKCLEKRRKEGYFVSEGSPCEIYIADYENADDNVEGSYINLMTESEDTNK